MLTLAPRIGSLFSGYGGLDLGVQAVVGGHVVWHAENDRSASRVLAHHWPHVPNLGDVTSVDWSAVEPVDVLTAGFPCQDVSSAGLRAGLAPGTRSGLWSEVARAVDALRPALLVVENVRGLLSAPATRPAHAAAGDVGCDLCDLDDPGEPPVRALGAVLGDLADLGYDARWCGVRAADAGAPHGRWRVFLVAEPADATHFGRERDGRAGPAHGAAADTASDGRNEGRTEPVRLLGRADAPECGPTAPDPDGAGLRGLGREQPEPRDPHRRGDPDTAWGPYEPAVRRWERVLGRPAPAPTEPGRSGPVLSPVLVEWMLGLPAGHVTDVPGISRRAQLRILGNGVVPQQAALALRWLLHGEWEPAAAEVGLMPTPSAADSMGGHLSRSGDRADELLLPGVAKSLALLPTPAVNDMGAGKTVDQWDTWTGRMKAAHGNGNGHGDSLAIEALRLVTPPAARDLVHAITDTLGGTA